MEGGREEDAGDIKTHVASLHCGQIGYSRDTASGYATSPRGQRTTIKLQIGMSALLLSLLSSCLIFSVSRASAYICLSNGKQQKLSPSVEPGLRKCQQYSSNACCSSDHFHAEPVSPFPWDQCGPLSSRCEAQISKVECMYLCSPDIAAWHNPESNSGIKELPLCSEFCDQWFEACKDDLICSGNHAANANCSQDCISYRQGTQELWQCRRRPNLSCSPLPFNIANRSVAQLGKGREQIYKETCPDPTVRGCCQLFTKSHTSSRL
uniref:Folate receptor-like domain-containing protein n=1 Tax=Leptobrachium leishanense TaxID=445787 RepID=A0A8C5Q4C5_9ANUR